MLRCIGRFSSLIIFSIALLGPQGLNAQEEELLPKSVSSYYIALQRNDVKTLWALFSPMVKQDWGKYETFEEGFKKFYEGSKLVSFRIGDIKKMSNNTRIVHTQIVLHLDRTDEFKEIKNLDRTRWLWIPDHKQWFYDGKVPDEPGTR